MGKADYFHKDGIAEIKRSALLNSNDKQERIKGLKSAIRHHKKHDDELRLMIQSSEEQIADWSHELKDLESEL